MRKFICTTTVNKPTEAIEKFASFKDWELIVAGDIRTPHNDYKNRTDLIYISPDRQNSEYPRLSRLIEWNCIQRRNFAFIEAVKYGADIIASVDDDNIPYKYWGREIYVGNKVRCNVFTSKRTNCFDPIYPTGINIWHRGFPLQKLKNRIYTYDQKEIKVDIQADFWNFDPDIDAIQRFIRNDEIVFSDSCFPFSTDLITPFNSQNTFLSRDAIKKYFMFPCIGRMDDIWASFYMTALGFKVLYNRPTVYQQRNDHDTTKDFMNEIIGYENNHKIVDDLCIDKNLFFKYLPERAKLAYDEYCNIMESF